MVLFKRPEVLKRGVRSQESGVRRRWGDGEMGRWGDGEMGRWGDGEKNLYLFPVPCSLFPVPCSLFPSFPITNYQIKLEYLSVELIEVLVKHLQFYLQVHLA
ncbi:MAG: hypothetical protein EAZ76_00755 [Nostocales cyanobacterium]|nr:MAG: hypothetical protein EAZ76_00755 [Nostocales cyanobacterium]